MNNLKKYSINALLLMSLVASLPVTASSNQSVFTTMSLALTPNTSFKNVWMGIAGAAVVLGAGKMVYDYRALKDEKSKNKLLSDRNKSLSDANRLLEDGTVGLKTHNTQLLENVAGLAARNAEQVALQQKERSAEQALKDITEKHAQELRTLHERHAVALERTAKTYTAQATQQREQYDTENAEQLSKITKAHAEQLAVAQQQLATARAEVDTAKAKLERSIAGFNQQLSQQQQEIADAIAARDAAVAQIARVQGDCQRLWEEKQDLEKRAHELLGAHEAAQSNAAELAIVRAELGRYRSLAEGNERRLLAAEQRISQATAERDRTAQELAHIQRDYQRLVAERSAVPAVVVDLHDRAVEPIPASTPPQLARMHAPVLTTRWGQIQMAAACMVQDIKDGWKGLVSSALFGGLVGAKLFSDSCPSKYSDPRFPRPS